MIWIISSEPGRRKRQTRSTRSSGPSARYLAYSALFRKHQATVQLVESAESLYFTPIVLGKLKAGFLLGRRGEENESALREFLQSLRVSVLAIHDETEDRWAIITAFLKKSGTPVASNNIWIAASAMQHGLPILTSDRDFQKILHVIVYHFLPV